MNNGIVSSIFTAGLLLVVISPISGADPTPPNRTGVSFHTSDSNLQHIFDAAESKELQNIVQFTPDMKALVEGGGYTNVWIETQPMGGEMYAKRNLEVALNNQLVFIRAQRADGRLPGMIGGGNALNPTYDWLQGYCFPDPAWKMYFWTGKDRDYLLKLYSVLEAHDNYLWRTRNPNGDGLLETWCTWDTGEDHCTRYMSRFSPTRWPFDYPPVGDRLPDPHDPKNFQAYWMEYKVADPAALPTRAQVLVPFASMDLMGYSHDGRTTLAKIAHELKNGREDFWLQQAAAVRKRLNEGLWNPQRHACFDRDRTGKVMDELIHNNLRGMYYGAFSQAMADEFVGYHLLNPGEFWTPLPLPSIAVHDPLYRNDSENNWSGQPEGLTYQRAIRALENYGHYAEVVLLGRKLIAGIGPEARFTQQFDAIAAKPSSPGQDSYGPTILALLEYCSRMDGVYLDVEHNQVWWSGLEDGGQEFTYTQRWGNREWTLSAENGKFSGRLNGHEVFSCTRGVRVVTDLEGKVDQIVGIDPLPKPATLHAGAAVLKIVVNPNQTYGIDGTVHHSVPFDYPFHY